jgi:hypothetical protein
MPTLVTSKHLQGTTELTLIAEIKPGLVPVAEPMSYAFRLRRVLEFLFLARQSAVERYGQVGSAGPLERLRMLHFVHWAIHDGDRKLLLAVSFDGPWEPYIRAIVEDAGPILDVIFSHCTGYEGHSCFDGYEAFSAWVRDRQINCDFFYAGAPDVTVDDLRYLQEFERGHANGKRRAPFEAVSSRLRVGEPPPPQLDAEQRKGLLGSLYNLRALFPENAAAKATPSSDAFAFGRIAALLTRELRVVLANSGAAASDNEVVRWALQDLSHFDVTGTLELPNETPRKLHEIQGNVLSAYEAVTHGCVLLGRFESRERALAFVERFKLLLTTEEPTSFPDDCGVSPATRVNFALTPQGLTVLGLSPDELAHFPKEFQEGLAKRAGMLGDVGRNHPSQWELPEHNWPKSQGDRVQLACIDFAIVLECSAPDSPLDHRFSDAHPLFSDTKAIAEWPGIEILHVRTLCHYERGHFGLVDGKSQPRHRATKESVANRDRVALGELLLGYANDRGEKRLSSALPGELLLNSTFLVMRQMSLDVPGFREAVSEAGNSGLDEGAYVEKVLGRRADGTALIETQATDNDFDFQSDPSGAKCPLFSHVRRANPRITRRVEGREVSSPRIVRRGMSYGPLASAPGEDHANEERGLVFMAYCASIAEQYEVIQRWVNGGNSSGTLSAHADPLAGNFPERNGFERLLSCTHEGRPISIPLPQRPLAQLKWGLYLFVPSVGALEFLLRRASTASLAAEPAPDDILEFVREMHELESLHPHRAALAWKLVLEDRDQRLRAKAIWEYIRQNGGALRTAYGVLVGSAEGVETVLSEHKRFSVRRYWHRMQRTFGVHYLGMDPEPQPLERTCPVSAHRDDGDFAEVGDEYPVGTAPYVPEGAYHRVAAVPNQFALEISSVEAYRSAYARTLSWFEAPRDGIADLRQLAREVIYDVARELIGTPPTMDAGPETSSPLRPPGCPLDFQRVSQFVFHPRPSVALARLAEARGKVLLDAITGFVSDPAPLSRFSKFFRERVAKQEPETTQYTGTEDAGFELNGLAGEGSALTGLINGFSVPTNGSFLSIANQWLDTQRIYRLQRWLLQSGDGEREQRARLLEGNPEPTDISEGPLFSAMIEAMANGPVPDLLHRVATGSTQPTHAADDEIEGVLLSRGDRVVVSLSSAAIDAQRRGKRDFASILFGGNRDALDYPVHACPGQKMALGVLTGMLVGILRQPGLGVVQALTLRFNPNR